MKPGLSGIEIYHELFSLYVLVQEWCRQLQDKTTKRKELVKEMRTKLDELAKKLSKSEP